MAGRLGGAAGSRESEEGPWDLPGRRLRLEGRNGEEDVVGVDGSRRGRRHLPARGREGAEIGGSGGVLRQSPIPDRGD